MISALLVEMWMRYFLILGRAMVSHNVIFCGLYLHYVESSRCQRYFSSPHFSAKTPLYKPIHFRQFTALLKYTSISTKFGLRILGYIVEKKTAFSFIQSTPRILELVISNTVTNRLFTLLCFSLCTRLFVTSREFIEREQFVNRIIIWILNSIATMDNISIYQYHYETEKTVSDLIIYQFHNSLKKTLILYCEVFELILRTKSFSSHSPNKTGKYATMQVTTV